MDICLQDLQLMHHYSTVTALDLSHHPPLQHIWQIDIPKDAVSYDFLMHEVLAFSALHMAHLSSANRGRYEESGVLHEQLALKLFMPVFNCITSDNWHAIFAFTALLGLVRLALPQRPQLGSEIDRLIEFLQLMRGPLMHIACSRQFLTRRGLGVLFDVDDTTHESVGRLYAPDLGGAVLASLQSLRDLNRSIVKAENVRNAYTESIDDLQTAFDRIIMSPRKRSLVFLWPVILKDPYMKLLQARQPMALVILAHYGVILHTINDQWWARALGSQLVKTIHDTLDEKWKDTMRWPVEMVKIDTEMIQTDKEWL